MGGVFDVATVPESRRQGHARRTIAELLAAIRASGAVLSCLYPFRESFYERLGYMTFPQVRVAKFSPQPLQPVLKRPLEGEVSLCLAADGYEEYAGYMQKLRAGIHGFAIFDHGTIDWARRRPQWLALARAGGEIVGVMAYTLQGDRPTEYVMRVSRFYYHSREGRYLLLDWIARHIDQASRVEIRLPSRELPETWLPDLAVQMETFWLAPMGRVLDVAGLAGLPAGPGRFSAAITDPICPWNEGAWQFESMEGVLHISRATVAADCALGVQALSALVYGTNDPADFAYRGWGSAPVELQPVLRSIFPPALPHLHEYF